MIDEKKCFRTFLLTIGVTDSVKMMCVELFI